MTIAVEGKSTEGDYDSVRKWMKKGSENRSEVLMHWLQMIAKQTGTSLDKAELSKFDHVDYQMIHRTASACSLEKPRTAVVYQVFHIDEKKKLPNYKRKLTDLTDAIGASGKLDISLQMIDTVRTKEYHKMSAFIEKLHKQERPQIVRNAIMDGRLFEFRNVTWERLATCDA